MSGFFFDENIKCSCLDSEEDVEREFLPIKKSITRLIKENEELKKENKKLKDEHYKDKELSELRNKLNKEEVCSLHYGLREKDYKKLINWKDNHIIDTHKEKIRNAYHFEIEEFPECTCYSVVCNQCGKMEHIYY